MRINVQTYLTPKQQDEFYINARKVESKGQCNKVNNNQKRLGEIKKPAVRAAD